MALILNVAKSYIFLSFLQAATYLKNIFQEWTDLGSCSKSHAIEL